MNKYLVFIVNVLLLINKCNGQGNFVNINYESALLNVSQSHSTVLFASAFPGWTGRIGSAQVSSALYNDGTLGTGCITILGPGDMLPGPIIEGQYSAMLVSGMDPDAGFVYVDTSISQSGLVPANSQYIILKAYGDPFAVRMDGNLISMSPVVVESGYTLYAGNISPYAGQTSDLTITALAGTRLNVVGLDSIVFASVPEPSFFTLFLCGMGMVLWIRRRQQRPRKFAL